MARKRKASRPVQADIARELGISVSTISRVLSNAAGISDEVRERVHETADRLGYTAHRSADSQALDRIIVLTALAGATAALSYVYQSLLTGVQDSARAICPQVDTQMCSRDNPLPEAIDKRLDSRTGLMLAGLDPSEATLRALRDRGIPVVLVNGLDASMVTDTVSPGNYFGGRIVAHHALGLGHKRLLYITGHERWTLRRRLQGFEAGVAEFGGGAAEVVSVLQARSEEPDRTVREIADWFQRDADGATAIICFNDALAIYAIQAMQSLGLSVPRDVSVIGFDDMPMATMISPRLTTVHVAWWEIGVQAVTLMQRRVARPDTPSLQAQIGSHLVVRDSAGPAPRS